MLKRVLRIALLMGLTLCPSPLQAQCQLLTQWGIYDYTTLETEESRISSFINWFRNHKRTGSSSSNETSNGATFLIDGIPVTDTFMHNEQAADSMNHLIEQYQSGSEDAKRRIKATSKIINTRMVEALEKCLTQKGLHVWRESGFDPFTFRVAAYFNSPGRRLPDARHVEMDVFPAANCMGRFTRKGGATVYGNTVRERCTRRGRDAVTITMNADVEIVQGSILDMEAIPPKVPPKVVETFMNVMLNKEHAQCIPSSIPANQQKRLVMMGWWSPFAGGSDWREAEGTVYYELQGPSGIIQGPLAYTRPVLLPAPKQARETVVCLRLEDGNADDNRQRSDNPLRSRLYPLGSK